MKHLDHNASRPTAPQTSEDLTILIIEDELLIALEMQMEFERHGVRVLGPFNTLDDAMVAARVGGFDIAILDVDLYGRETFPIADYFNARGIPFVWHTGNASRTVFFEHYADVTLFEKPAKSSEILEGICTLLGCAKPIMVERQPRA